MISKHNITSIRHGLLPGACLLMACGVFAVSDAHAQSACERIAELGHRSCRAELIEEYYAGIAVCANQTGGERAQCRHESREAYNENRRECRRVRRARQNVCDRLNVDVNESGTYQPEFAGFIHPSEIATQPNPWLPLHAGNRWVYVDGEETETVTVEVSTATKAIEDATCVVVTDTVTQDFTEDEFEHAPVFGAVTERTDDWFAQDINGNVIYCGEISLEAEPQPGDNPVLPSEIIGTDGSWKWGRDGALAGYIMFANPVPGTMYRAEYFFDEAEDIARVIRHGYVFGAGDSLDQIIPQDAVDILGLCDAGCVVIIDSTPLEPGVNEYKFYAPGTGLILEVKPDDEEPEYLKLAGCNVPGSSCPPLVQ